ncbi:MAG TPA: phosphoribosylformylglycinamidine synthase subunit PurQ [Acidobacteriota bacterium]|nr:phosphoribosylformylglycinamidine synthase subunit PurQ [Acidobacteriota bacterium]
MRVGVVYFPGSNCEQDAAYACRQVGLEAEYVWHKRSQIEGFDALILPGGFSYGDHLRCGAIACSSPIMPAVEQFAGDGGLVLGICNGFQILAEMGMLPGTLLANDGLKFRCQDTVMRVERNDSPFTNACEVGQVLRINMAHYEGNYFAEPDALQRLEANGQVLMRFASAADGPGGAFNPNGSIADIAAVSNDVGNVMGLMPHPERAMRSALGSTDGRFVFESLRRAIEARGRGQANAVTQKGEPARV